MGKIRNICKNLSRLSVAETINEDANNAGINMLLKMLNLEGVSGDKLSEATYFACLKILSESIGKLPFKLLQKTSEGGIVKAYKHPLYNILSIRPNPYMTATHFWSTMEYNRNHYGNAYSWITGAGKNMELWPLPSNNVEMWVDDAGLWSGDNKIWYIYNHKGDKRYKIPFESMLHFKTSTSFNGIKGISVRDKLSMTLEDNMRAQNLLGEMYKSGFTAKAALQYTGSLNDENVKKFVKGIEDYATGKIPDLKNIIPIPIGSSLQPLNVKLADNQFVEVKKYSALQIASAFGIKPNQINDYDKSSYSAAEQQNLAFYTDTLLYILKQYEEECTYKLLSKQDYDDGYFTKFNVSVILRADQKTQIETLKSAVDGGVYTVNEARSLLDMPSKPNGDRLLINGNMIPVEMAGMQYDKKKEEEGR